MMLHSHTDSKIKLHALNTKSSSPSDTVESKAQEEVKQLSYLIHKHPVTVFGGQVGFYSLWRWRKESEVMSTVTCSDTDSGSLGGI